MLIKIDGHSKWIDAIPLRSATAKTTTDVLGRFFASFGLPKEQLVTMHIIGFKILIPPYYMVSNRTAKRAIQVRSEADYAEDGKPVTTSTTTSKIPTDILYNTS